MYIDTHSHIYDEAFDNDRESAFQRALSVGVETILLPNTDETTIKPMMDFYESHQENCKVMMGLHPEGVKDDYKRHLSVIEKEMEKKCWVAIGEIGLDLYWDKTFEKHQVEVLKEQLRWAKQLHLPVSLHTREAFDLMFKVLESEQDGNLSGVFHCFNGTKEQADIAISLGFHYLDRMTTCHNRIDRPSMPIPTCHPYQPTRMSCLQHQSSWLLQYRIQHSYIP